MIYQMGLAHGRNKFDMTSVKKNGRIILYNPHLVTFFGKTLYDCILGSREPNKYSYFKLLFKKRDLAILIDEDKTSIKDKIFLNFKIVNLILFKFEIYFWLLINGINPIKVKIIKNRNLLNGEDVLIVLSHTNIEVLNDNVINLMNLEPTKLILMSHYFFNTSVISKAVNIKSNTYLISENNLKKNSKYFNYYFPKYEKEVYTLPFVLKNKFKSNVNIEERKKKCLAIGSFIILDNNPALIDFKNYFNLDTFHPMRKYLYYNKESVSDHIDSFISCVNDDYKEVINTENIKLNRIKFVNKIRHLYLTHFKLLVGKREYYKFDIVKLFNGYQMFVCPEEICDLPGIGFIEGMACGCLYLGKADSMYSDIGLIDGVHYVSYDGTIIDLLNKIEFLTSNFSILKKISEEGQKYVTSNFNSINVSKLFYNDIISLKEKIILNDQNHSHINFNSSFVKKTP